MRVGGPRSQESSQTDRLDRANSATWYHGQLTSTTAPLYLSPGVSIAAELEDATASAIIDGGGGYLSSSFKFKAWSQQPVLLNRDPGVRVCERQR